MLLANFIPLLDYCHLSYTDAYFLSLSLSTLESGNFYDSRFCLFLF